MGGLTIGSKAAATLGEWFSLLAKFFIDAKFTNPQCLGLPEEHVQYLVADHRRICKFQDHGDPNDNVLLSCFRTTLDEIERGWMYSGVDHSFIKSLRPSLTSL